MDEYGDQEIEKRENQPELQKGREYLVKRTMYDPFHIRVLDVTEKAYRFQYENGNTTWVEKDYYNNTYTFVEDITDFKIQKEVKTFMEQEFEVCGLCGGTGQIPDDNSTAGTKICPRCNGSGQVLKSSTFKTFE